MANEITYSLSLAVAKANGPTYSRTISGSRADMAGSHLHATTQDIGTAYEAVVVPAEVATKGFAFFKNLDATNYLEIGVEVSSAFYAFAKLKAGQSALVPLSNISLFAKANTGACILELAIVEL